MYTIKSEPLIYQIAAAARIDALLEQAAIEYRSLPRRDFLALHFREALARVGLPGGYIRRGAVARPLSELIPVSSNLERNL